MLSFEKYIKAMEGFRESYYISTYYDECLNNLTDSLQEIFDKFDIKHYKTNKESIINWYINPKLGTLSIGLFSPNSDEKQPIIDEISDKMNLIEKRTGCKVEIVDSDISIKIKVWPHIKK